jgi:Zn ribbon nucleic-acid-binding protein
VRLDELPEADSRGARICGCDVDGAGDLQSVRSLECVECGRVSREGERGWRAHLTAEDDGGEDVAAYCPKCDEREFGEQ